MYKKGSEPIVVHPAQIVTAQIRGWSLDEDIPATKKKTIKPLKGSK